MIDKIAFTHYSITDMDRSVDFYKNILGLNLLFRRDEWTEFSIGGQRFALHKVDSVAQPKDAGGAIVSLEAKQIKNTIAFLKERGVRFVQDLQEFPYGKMAVFLDPDNNMVGLYEAPKRKNVGMG